MNQNMYEPPKSELIDNDDRASDLASRWARLGAAMIDSLIGLAFSLPVLYISGAWDYMSTGQTAPISILAFNVVAGFIIFMALHGYLLKSKGQTIGKKLVGTAIVDMDGNLPVFSKVVLLRYLPLSLISIIPLVGNFLALADSLFIFRKNKRCVHDLIAGTKVIKV